MLPILFKIRISLNKFLIVQSVGKGMLLFWEI